MMMNDDDHHSFEQAGAKIVDTVSVTLTHTGQQKTVVHEHVHEHRQPERSLFHHNNLNNNHAHPHESLFKANFDW